MTSRSDFQQHNTEQPADEQQPRLQTVEDQHKWEAKWAPVLDAAEEARNRKFDDAEAERFARATDAIIVAFRQLRKLGHSRDGAGAVLVYDRRGSFGDVYTPADLLVILKKLGSNYAAKRRIEPCFPAVQRV